MQLRRIISVLVILTVALAPTLARAGKDEELAKFEIRKFRFRRHNTKNFERLVIQFTGKNQAGPKPSVKIIAPTTGKEATIEIGNANLVGAIPEALINDSYVSRSHFLGPVSINTDGPEAGFTIRTFLKAPVGVDAFWLEHPDRLVLDVFPRALRAWPVESPKEIGTIEMWQV